MTKQRNSEYSDNITFKGMQKNKVGSSSEPEENNNNVIGAFAVGGCGSNILSYIHSTKTIPNVDFYAINTDKEHLFDRVPSGIEKILIGDTITEGLGTGYDPKKGKKSALMSQDEIKKALKGKEIIYLIAGLGKGTGGGASIEIAKMASEMGIVVLGIFVCAAFGDGELAQKNALECLEELEDIVDASSIILNDKLDNLRGTAEEVEQKQISIPADSVLNISEIINTVYEVNIDTNDAKRILQKSGRTVFIREEAKGENRVQDILSNIEKNSEFTNRSIKNAKKLLYCIIAHDKSEVQNLELTQIKRGIKRILNSKTPLNEFIPGRDFDKNLDKKSLRVLIIATGFPDKAISELRKSYEIEAKLFEEQFEQPEKVEPLEQTDSRQPEKVEPPEQTGNNQPEKVEQTEQTDNNTTEETYQPEPTPKKKPCFIPMGDLVKRDFAHLQKCSKDLTDRELQELRIDIPREYLDWTSPEESNDRINPEGHVD